MESFANGIFLVLLLVLVGWGYFSDRTRKMRHSARNALIWLFLIGGATAGALIWEDWRYSPKVVMSNGVEEIRIPQNITGEYRTDIVINENVVNTIIDTGASELFLSRHDALTLGIDLDNLKYVSSAMTANGRVRIAKVRLDRLSIGGHELRDIPAYISNGEQSETLLGMTVLDRFSSVAISDGILTLRP